MPFLRALALAAATAACASSKRVTADAGVRDSAGVHIVESATPRWTDSEAWRVTDTALLSIGETVHDSAEYELSTVLAAFRLSDGRVVVANGQTRELRFFDRTGRFLKTVGRRGQGPGEFGESWIVVRYAGDTLVVNSSGQLTFVSDTGTLLPAVTVPGTLDLVGVFADGRILLDRGELAKLEDDSAVARPPIWGEPRGHDASGAYDEVAWYSPVRLQFWNRLQVADPDGKARRRYGDFPGERLSVVFGADGWLALQRDHFYFAHSKDFDIAVYRADGTLERRVRRPWTRVAVEDADVERYLATVRAQGRLPTGQRESERITRGLQIADTMPAHGKILIDPDENIWVQAYRSTDAHWITGREKHALPRGWSVFDSSGVWLGELETPAGLDVREVGRDYVVGITRDDDEVERVAVHSLIKPR
jgi:6-bladed beta-propeller protein